MRRNFVIEQREGESDLRFEVRKEMVSKLAREWNEYHSRLEERRWRSRDERDAESEYIGGLADNAADDAVDAAWKANKNISKEEMKRIREEALQAFDREWKAKEEHESEKILVIEELLSELGGRMARPYEHWNEEEAYMQWSETRYDDPRDYDY